MLYDFSGQVTITSNKLVQNLNEIEITIPLSYAYVIPVFHLKSISQKSQLLELYITDKSILINAALLILMSDVIVRVRAFTWEIKQV